MLRSVQGVWDAFFPTEPVFPLQIVGGAGATVVESKEQLAAALHDRFFLFTYRCSFEPIPAVARHVITDQGWGCLVRTTQMLLAHFLWVYGRPEDRRLSLFFDHSDESAPFSIHNMIQQVWHKRAFHPEYWSPSQGCEAVRHTMQRAVKTAQIATRVSVVTSCNGCIYADEVQRAFKEGAEVVLVLAAVRVSAASHLNQESYLQIEKLMEQPQCLGVVGGVPGRSYYFFAHNQTQVLYLDPHQRTSPALMGSGAAAVASVTPSLLDVRCVHWSRVDTSLFIAFALRSRGEWAALEGNITTRFLHVEVRQTRREFDQLVRPPTGDGAFLSPLAAKLGSVQSSSGLTSGADSQPVTTVPAQRRTLRLSKGNGETTEEGEGGNSGGGAARAGASTDSESWEYLE